MSVRLYHGDMREVLATYGAETIDAVVCDPPYELGFMGKRWDASGVSFDPETWRACYRVLKPGGHLLAFGGTRTVHRIAVAIEDAGFEIRDQIAWLFGSGFPKSHNLGNGYGTALKPAMEPIVVARKPLIGTVAANVTAHGTGALNIDGCRVEIEAGDDLLRFANPGNGLGGSKVFCGSWNAGAYSGPEMPHPLSARHDARGRWPANVALDEEAAALLDAQSGERKSGGCMHDRSGIHGSVYGVWGRNRITKREADTGGASRFFYVAKASRSERNAGLEGMPERFLATMNNGIGKREHNTSEPSAWTRNHHPTVKPIALMRWLIRLVSPPDGAVILDPFLGSGTTGIAAVMEDVHFVGIEQSAEYLEIARRRIAHAQGPLFAQVNG